MTAKNVPAVAPGSDLARSLSAVDAYRNQRAVRREVREAVLRIELEYIDVTAATAAAVAHMEAEVYLYRKGMEMAGGDPALEYLVARKLAAFAEANNIVLIWKFRR